MPHHARKMQWRTVSAPGECGKEVRLVKCRFDDLPSVLVVGETLQLLREGVLAMYELREIATWGSECIRTVWSRSS